MAGTESDEQREIHDRFSEAVNMTPKELEDWLETDESRDVGQKSGGKGSEGGESVGHESGRRIVEILRTKKADLSDDDYQHMQKVAGYVARHAKQRPDGDVRDTKWRYSLMNWGNDPLK
ncbi:DUF3140 domain-containing protein [Kineococcus gynurae]|uniref:DUF3140 domain-containing protein n=1 Tax=Kineococcus gynurae TaxID=452979 RepID=A0ABV5LWH7_9ACTN